MGREAECAVTYNGTRAVRKVLLETDELILRGEPAASGASEDQDARRRSRRSAGRVVTRVVVKRAAIRRAEASAGTLLIEWSGGEARLALGPDAAKWAHDIANPRTRIDKLGVKAGQKVALVGVKDDALRAELEKVGAVVSKAKKDLDAVFLQVDKPAGLAKIAGAAKAIAPAGAVWVLTPRGSGVKDTDVMAAGKKAGLVDVKVVRFSETHSANKLVIPVAKRKAR